MLSKIFIDRPIFAWVIAIVIMLAGIGGIVALPVAQYPDIAPPSVNIRGHLPGRLGGKPSNPASPRSSSSSSPASTG